MNKEEILEQKEQIDILKQYCYKEIQDIRYKKNNAGQFLTQENKPAFHAMEISLKDFVIAGQSIKLFSNNSAIYNYIYSYENRFVRLYNEVLENENIRKNENFCGINCGNDFFATESQICNYLHNNIEYSLVIFDCIKAKTIQDLKNIIAKINNQIYFHKTYLIKMNIWKDDIFYLNGLIYNIEKESFVFIRYESVIKCMKNLIKEEVNFAYKQQEEINIQPKPQQEKNTFQCVFTFHSKLTDNQVKALYERFNTEWFYCEYEIFYIIFGKNKVLTKPLEKPITFFENYYCSLFIEVLRNDKHKYINTSRMLTQIGQFKIFFSNKTNTIIDYKSYQNGKKCINKNDKYNIEYYLKNTLATIK